MIDVDHNPVETEEGVWTEFKGTRLLIAHVSSMAFQRKLARLQQPYAKKIEKGTLSPDIQKAVLCKAMAGTILKDAEFVKKAPDWTKEKPTYLPVAFTVELAEQVIGNQHDVREFVTAYSDNLDNFRQEEADELGKS